MLARNTNGHARCRSSSRGWKSENTLSWVSSVWAWPSSTAYSPRQRNVRPGAVSSPSRSTPRLLNVSRCSGGKSSPTTATMRTGAKWQAESEKYEAEPPSASPDSPNGVRTESSATEPTTTISAGAAAGLAPLRAAPPRRPSSRRRAAARPPLRAPPPPPSRAPRGLTSQPPPPAPCARAPSRP